MMSGLLRIDVLDGNEVRFLLGELWPENLGAFSLRSTLQVQIVLKKEVTNSCPIIEALCSESGLNIFDEIRLNVLEESVRGVDE